MITPYGTILELNIGNDLTFNPVHDEKALADPADKDPSKGYVVAETRKTILPKWKVEEWNIYEKIIKKEETSTCKLEGWHNKLDKILMKPHPSFEEFCKVLMGEWVKIDYEMDHLESGFTRADLKFKASKDEQKRQERIYNVAMSVNTYHTIIDYWLLLQKNKVHFL